MFGGRRLRQGNEDSGIYLRTRQIVGGVVVSRRGLDCESNFPSIAFRHKPSLKVLESTFTPLPLTTTYNHGNYQQ